MTAMADSRQKIFLVLAPFEVESVLFNSSIPAKPDRYDYWLTIWWL